MCAHAHVCICITIYMYLYVTLYLEIVQWRQSTREEGAGFRANGVLGALPFLPLAEEAGPASHSSSCFRGCGEEAGVSKVWAGVSLGPSSLLGRQWTCPERLPCLRGGGDISTVGGLGVAGWCLWCLDACEYDFSSVIWRPSWPRLLSAGPLCSGPHVCARVCTSTCECL